MGRLRLYCIDIIQYPGIGEKVVTLVEVGPAEAGYYRWGKRRFRIIRHSPWSDSQWWKERTKYLSGPKTVLPEHGFPNGMMSVIRHVQNRLSGNMDSGSVINLNTAFGGENPHTRSIVSYVPERGEGKKVVAKRKLRACRLPYSGHRNPESPSNYMGRTIIAQRTQTKWNDNPWGQILGQLGPEAVKN